MPLIEQIILPRDKDLGGFTVRRILPFAKRRMVGPFIFLDHMGPAGFAPGEGMDVRPHPHIGLATVTYLFEGEIIHRDTLGSHRAITVGDVNWMTAGRGIAHSERTGSTERGRPHRMHGLQSWVALPKDAEECAPEFFHHPAATLPKLSLPGAALTIIAGEAFGKRAPVKTYSPVFYVEALMEKGASLTLPNDYSDRAAYIVSGDVHIAGERIAPLTLPVFHANESVTITADAPSRVMLLGGEPFPEARHIWWNFVSSSEARLEQAKLDWKNGIFGTIPGDENEFIPLPAA